MEAMFLILVAVVIILWVVVRTLIKQWKSRPASKLPPPPAPGAAGHDLLAGAITATVNGRERTPPPDPAEFAAQCPDFEILDLIGQGGMGAVYRARRRADAAVVALKLIRLDGADGDAMATRFAREAEALERLDHPNIVAIRSHGRSGPWCWLAMDLVEGANLREVVATGRLSPAQALALVPPLCAALQYAHDQGVVHRDIKPENILLDAAGVPRIVDFGLAKFRDPVGGDSLTRSGAVLGTVHYMAPEQIERAKEVDHRADIYAFGVVLYELLTGRLPIGRFEVPSQQVRVDVRIDEVVMKALERDPERRWQQAGQVGQAVRRIGDGSVLTPGKAAEPGPVSAPGAKAWAAIALFVLLAIGTAIQVTSRAGPFVMAIIVGSVAGLLLLAFMAARPWLRWVMGISLALVALLGLLLVSSQQQAEREESLRRREQAARQTQALLDALAAAATRSTAVPEPTGKDIAAVHGKDRGPAASSAGSATAAMPIPANHWNDVDTRIVARGIADSLREQKWLGRPEPTTGRRWSIRIGSLQQDGDRSDAVDGPGILQEITRCLVAGGTVEATPLAPGEEIDRPKSGDYALRSSCRITSAGDRGEVTITYRIGMEVLRISDRAVIWSDSRTIRKTVAGTAASASSPPSISRERR